MKKIIITLLTIMTLTRADIKPIFIMVYDTGCDACSHTIKLIAKDRELGNTITNLTKPFQMSVKEAEQNNLLVRSVPTFFILDPNTNQMLVKPLEGAIKDPRDFIRFIRQIYNALN